MILNSVITIKKVKSAEQTATGEKKTYEDLEVRGTLKNITPGGAKLYQTQGYSQVEKEVVIYDRHDLPKNTVDFAGKVLIKDPHTNTEKEYEITTPAVKRGNYLTFGVQSEGD